MERNGNGKFFVFGAYCIYVYENVAFLKYIFTIMQSFMRAHGVPFPCPFTYIFLVRFSASHLTTFMAIILITELHTLE